MLLSGPDVIPFGVVLVPGTRFGVTAPDGVILSTAGTPDTVNHIFPSSPGVML